MTRRDAVGPRIRRHWIAAVAVAVAAAVFFVGLAWSLRGGGSVDLPWAPTLGLRLQLALDGLAALYVLLASGIGALVFAYATAYMPRHMGHEQRPPGEARRFWLWMLLFMASMVGLACSLDLILLFVFFDLTAVASYFLIGFDRGRLEARGAAQMALVVTGVSGVAMLAGAVVLYTTYGTFSIPELFTRATPGPSTAAGCALILVAALAKSAQVPLHFWLPRAMAAPTPVSAYLHSAAMVAAGVLVIGRVHPLLALEPAILDGLIVIGFASILVGGVIALAKDELKQVLAHSTISQYGYVVVLYGIGGEAGASAAALYVLAHAIAKSALFMTAGAVTEATGEDRLSRLGGLARPMPVLAVASGIAAGALAALPLTLGFFKDELFFTAALGRGGITTAMAVAAAALTFAYIGRFWLGVFLGAERSSPRPVPLLLSVPVVVLAVLALLGGVAVAPFAALAEGAARVTLGGTAVVAPAYHLDARAENGMAVAAWVLGAVVLAGLRLRPALVGVAARAGEAVGPRRVYALALAWLHRVSDRVHRTEVRDLRTSLAAVLVPTGILTLLGFLATPTEGAYAIGPVTARDVPVIAFLAVAVVAAVAVARDRNRFRAALGLSVVGFALAAVYAALGAPDVALVAVVVETATTLVFVGVISRLPSASSDRSIAPAPRGRQRRNVIAGVVTGVSAFAVIWGALSREPIGAADAEEHIRLAPSAHGGDVVTVILADFRGLDTMVEITVLFVAVIGAAALLRRRGGSW